MTNKTEAAAEEADNAVMALCTPDKMTPEQAIEYLENVVGRCQSAIEALREENDL